MKARKTLKTSQVYLINTVIIVLILVLGTLIYNGGALNRATKSVVIQVGIYSMLAVSLNICTGYLGQLPLGHAGFMAVGAYTGAIVWRATTALPGPLSIIIGLIAAGLLAAVFGILIGIPALRLKGDYLAIITLGFGEIIRIAVINLSGITGGTPGLLNIPKHSGFFVTYACLILCIVVVYMVMHSRQGRAILSIRGNEIAAESCGIDLSSFKVFAFALSAFFAGVAGAVYAGYMGSLFPKNFEFMTSINILVMVVLGGMGSMTGSVIAATVLTALPSLMQSFSQYRMVIYSLLLIVVMIFKPSGLMGTRDISLRSFIEKLMNREPIFKRRKGEIEDE